MGSWGDDFDCDIEDDQDHLAEEAYDEMHVVEEEGGCDAGEGTGSGTDGEGLSPETQLRNRVLYDDREPDWAAIDNELRQVFAGDFDAWFAAQRPKLEEKRQALWNAINQVEGARTHAAVLGIAPDATDEAKARAYKKLALVLHPDRHVNAPDAAAKRIEAAWKLVTNANDAELER